MLDNYSRIYRRGIHSDSDARDVSHQTQRCKEMAQNSQPREDTTCNAMPIFKVYSTLLYNIFIYVFVRSLGHQASS